MFWLRNKKIFSVKHPYLGAWSFIGILNLGNPMLCLGEQRQYWRKGNIRKQIFDDGRKGEQANLFQGTGAPLGGPPHSQGDFSPL